MTLDTLIHAAAPDRPINPETSLIDLPEGYFWRVTEYGRLYLMRRTVKPKTWWRGEKVEEKKIASTPILEDDGLSFSGLRWECNYILDRLRPRYIVGDF